MIITIIFMLISKHPQNRFIFLCSDLMVNEQVLELKALPSIESALGVTLGKQAWLNRDLSRKLRACFGKMTGLWRCHYAVSEALQLIVYLPIICCRY